MTPHCCPVCGGSGTMAAYFYDVAHQRAGTAINDHPVPCRSCRGTGVVWEPGCLTGTSVLAGGVSVTYHVCPHENQS